MMKNIRIKLMLLVPVALLCTSSFAKIYPFVKAFTQVTVNATNSISDPRPNDVYYNHIINNSPTIVTFGDKQFKRWTNNNTTWFDVNLKNRLVFYIKPEENCANRPFTATITVELKSKNYWNGTTYSFQTVNKTLVIKYDPKNIYSKKVVYEFDGGYLFEGRILALNMSNVAYSSALALDLEYEVESYTQFNPSTNYPDGLAHQSKEKYESEYRITWNKMDWAESYDLEWTVIDYYAEFINKSAEATSNIPNDVFLFNSTRINTSQNEFFIPAMYGKGILIYRIRGVGKSVSDGFEKDVVSKWSHEFDITKPLAEYNYFLIDGLERKLNWQFSTVYAEDGKNKVAVKYFDGTLRERQSVTKMNTGINMLNPNESLTYNNKVNSSVVSEIIYDHQGRPAINVLPVPTDDESLNYYKRFNLNSSSTPYNRNNFDIDRANPCAIATDPMSNDSGAANYYSPQNIFVTNIAHPSTNQIASFIPNANGYPFIQTLFTPDNTGKILAKSGLGPNFQIGTGKETKYHYVRPFQEELDRLFGADAGYAEHYQKNITIDPNGQISISYLNLQEKVVATSLVGPAPSQVRELNTRTIGNVEVDLLNKVEALDNVGKGEVIDLVNGTRILSQDFFVAEDGIRDFRYKLINNNYNELCGTTPICYECVLDLKISVKNSCGIEMLGGLGSANSTSITIDDENILSSTTSTLLNNCNGAPTLFTKGTITSPWQTNLSGAVTSLNRGVYSLTKSLSVNQQALDKYTSLYFNSNTCITSKYAEFELEELGKINVASCDFDCSQWLSQIGSTYASSPLNGTITESQWGVIYAEYLDNCANQNTMCKSAYTAMLADVSPSGQYGEVFTGGPGINSNGQLKEVKLNQTGVYSPLSVFNDYNYLPWKKDINTANPGYKPSWRFPLNKSLTGERKYNYLNELGELEYVYLIQDTTGKFIPAIEDVNIEFVELEADGRKKILPKYLKNLKDFLQYWKSSWAKSLVAYHPEYPFYEECLTRSLSNAFDEKWLSTKTVSEANNNFNVGSKNWNAPAGDGSTPLNILDPFINLLNPNIQALVRDKINNYMSVTGYGNLSMREAAIVMANCPDLQLSLTCTNGAITACLVGNTIDTDLEWATYRQLYFSLKQQILESYTTKKSILDGYYNGCIGIEPFDAFAYWFYNTPFDASAITPTLRTMYEYMGFYYLPTTSTSQFYNPEQTCNWARYWLYKNKIARYPQNRMVIDNVSVLNNNLPFPGSTISTVLGDLNGFLNLNDPEKTSATVEEARRLTDVASYRTACGQCSVGEAMVQLLNQLIVEQKITGTDIKIAEFCSSVPSTSEIVNGILLERLIGGPMVSGDILNFTGITNGNSFTARFTRVNGSTSTNREITFTLPSGYTINDIVQFCCIKGNMSITNKDNNDFSVTAFVKPKSGDQFYQANTTEFMTALLNENLNPLLSINITSTAPQVDLVHCEIPPVCRPSYAANQIKIFLNGVIERNTGLNGSANASVVRGSNGGLTITEPYEMLFTDELAKVLFPGLFDSYSNNIYKWAIDDLPNFKKTLTFTAYPVSNTTPLASCAINFELFLPNSISTPANAINNIVAINSIEPVLGRSKDGNITNEAIMEVIVSDGGIYKKAQFLVTSNCLELGTCTTGSPIEQKSGESVANKRPRPDVGNPADFIKVISDEFLLPPTSTSGNPCTDGIALMNFLLSKIDVGSSASGASEMEGAVNSGINLSNIGTITTKPGGANNTTTYPYCDCGVDVTEEDILVNGTPINKYSYIGIRSINQVAPKKFVAIVKTTLGIDVKITFELKAGCSITESEQNKVKMVAGSGDGPDRCLPKEVLGFHGFGLNIGTVPVWNLNLTPANWELQANMRYFFEAYNNGYTSSLDSFVNYRFDPDNSNHLPLGEYCIVPMPLDYKVGSTDKTKLYDNQVNYGNNRNAMIYRLPNVNTWHKLWERSATINYKKDYPYRLVVWHKPYNFTQDSGKALTTDNLELNFYFGSVQPSVLKTEFKKGTHVWYRYEILYIPSANSNGNQTVSIYVKTNNTDCGGLLSDVQMYEDCYPNICCPVPQPVFTYVNPCVSQLQAIAKDNAKKRYDEYVLQEKIRFQQNYIKHCLNVYEEFFMKFRDSEDQTTLYYYDQAGNLVRTIPPKGVNKITNVNQLAKIKSDRAKGIKTEYTEHSFKTTYTYNSLNQLINQSTPDNETMPIWKEQTSHNGIPSNYTVMDIHFTDKLNGLLIANDNSNGHFFKTSDGGKNWFEINAIGLPDLNHVFTLDNHYWIVGNKGTVMHKRAGTSNTTWEVREFPSAEKLIKVVLKNKETITNQIGPNHIKYTLLMYSESGRFWLTECLVTNETVSNLISWNVLGNNNDLEHQLNAKLKDVSLNGTSSNIGYAVSADGSIFVTEDAGDSWNPAGLDRFLDENLETVSASTDGTVYIGGTKGVLLKGGIVSGTVEQPARWSIIPTNLSESILKLSFSDPSNGFALSGTSSSKKLYKTTDGGKHFITLKNNGGTDLIVEDFHFTTPAIGVAVNSSGIVYITNNGGYTWTQYGAAISHFASYPAKFVRIILQGNQQHIIVAGDAATNGTILFYSNNPNTWTNINIGAAANNPLQNIYLGFNSNTNITAYLQNNIGEVRAVNNINNTTPTQVLLASNVTRMHINQLGSGVFYNHTNHGIRVITSANVNGTVNLSSEITLTGLTYTCKSFIANLANNNLLFIGDNGQIHAIQSFSSTNRAVVAVNKGIKLPPLHAVSTNNSNMVAAGESGYLVFGKYSIDRFAFKIKKAATAERLNDVWYDADKITAAGNDRTVVTTPVFTDPLLVTTITESKVGTANHHAVINHNRIGGENGKVQAITGSALNTPVTSNTVLCGASNFVAGKNGYMAFESANTYSQIQTITPDQLHHLFFTNNRVVYAAGTGQRLWKSIDGGQTWNFINLASQVSSGFVINAIHFTSELNGFIAGTDGKLYKTTNGGNSFSLVLTAASDINDIEIHSSGNGYLVGQNGLCMQTSNYGNAWNNYSIAAAYNNSPNLTAVSIPDYNVAYICGNAGVMIKIDILASTQLSALKSGAQSWPQFLISNQRSLLDVYFVDRQTGYVAGEAGFMMKTTDGGNNFRAEASGAGANNIRTLNMADANTIYTGAHNGVVTQIVDMKDKFSSRFYYDALGRLVVSQNAKQYNKLGTGETEASHLYYSYTQFDFKGRIVEVGELRAAEPIENLFNSFGLMDEVRFNTWVENGVRTEVTKTFYDYSPFAEKLNLNLSFIQQNLRNRVVASAYYPAYNNNLQAYTQASHYTYDIHGNVSTLIQENTLLTDIGHAFKRIDYKYDLVSGKVLEVAYQHKKPDRFYHRYEYDGDNRIVKVKTSYDYVVWEEDANYKYYLHGPLARTELGNDQIQGMDYVYTLQGWLKSVNGSNMDVNANFTIGKDGIVNSSNPNAYFAKDEIAFELKYYNNDYSPIVTAVNNRFTQVNSNYTTALNGRQIFNGNISGMVTAHRQLMVLGKAPIATAYQYDQLNRLKAADYYQINNNNEWNAVSDYRNTFSYDANGNILTQMRNGSVATGLNMDDLTYIYYSGTNKLRGVNDLVPPTAQKDDIDDQVLEDNAYNYKYDELGNLIEDKAEEIAQIVWNLSGKISKIIRTTGSTKPDLEFAYDPSGNRIMKTVYPKDANKLPVRTFYVRDAQGNIMATYTRQYQIDVNYGALNYLDVNNAIVNTGASFTPFIDWLHNQNNNNNSNFISALNAQLITLTSTQKANILNASSAYARDLLENINGLYPSTFNAYSDQQITQSAVLHSGNYHSMIEELCNCYAYINQNVNSNIPDFALYFFMHTAPRGNNSIRELFLRFLYDFNYDDPSQFYTFANDLGYTGGLNYEDAADYLLAYNDVANWRSKFYANFTCQQITSFISNGIQDGDPALYSGMIGQLLGSLPNIRTKLTSSTANCNIPYLQESDMKIALSDRSDIMSTMIGLGTFTNDMLTWLMNNRTSFMLTLLADNYREIISAAQISTNPYGGMESYFDRIQQFYGNQVYKTVKNQYQVSHPAYKDVLLVDEHPIYGSSRVGSYQSGAQLFVTTFTANLNNGNFSNIVIQNTNDMLAPLGTYEISRGKKHFELSNHLGNVLAVVSDKKLPQCAVQNKYDQPFTNTTGSWVAAGSGVSFVHENNRLKVTNTSTYIPVRSPNITGLTVGKRYVLTIDLERNSTSVVNAYLRWGTSSILYVRWMGAPGPVSYSIEFVPQTTSIQVELQGSTGIYFVDRVQVNEAEEEAGTYVSARAEVIQTGDYSPFGAPLANRDYKPIDEQNRNIIINTTYNEGTDGWVPVSGTTLGNSLGRLQFLTYSATSQSAQKVYAGLLTIGKKYRVSFDFIIDGITTATYTVTNGSTNVGTKLQSITTREVVEFTATSTNLTLMITLSAGNYGRLAHIDNLEVAEIAEIGEGYRFAFGGMYKDDEVQGDGNTYDFGARIYNPRLGQWLSMDAKSAKYPAWSPYNYAIDNPVVFVDPDGNDVIISVSATPVGTTKINLYSASEIAADPSLKDKTKIVPVYEVLVTNESGSTATFYFTRDAFRGQSDGSVKEVTFNVREDGDEFLGKIKSRWGGTDNVLELRDPDNINDQSVDAMKADEEVERTAIQFHVKGASDGCLLCVGKDQFESKVEGANINETDLKSNSGETQKNFMKKIKDFIKEDVDSGKGDKIKIKFEKVENEEETSN